MTITRTEIVTAARSLVGARYAHQGRRREIGLDCAGVLIKMAHLTGISEFELLGYSAEPDGELFGRLLDEHLVRLGSYWFAKLGDVLAFDFGKGVQHVAIVTKLSDSRFDWRRFTVVHAIRGTHKNEGGVLEGPLTITYSSKIARAYRVPALA